MALLSALMAMLMMLVITGGLTLTTTTESAISLNHRNGLQMLYAAESGIELGISVLRTTPDWQILVASGPVSLVSGPLADAVVSDAIDPRIVLAVVASPDPSGNPDILVLDSTASSPGASQRGIQATVMRLPPDAAGIRHIDILVWR
jgi:hypothetical protein